MIRANKIQLPIFHIFILIIKSNFVISSGGAGEGTSKVHESETSSSQEKDDAKSEITMKEIINNIILTKQWMKTRSPLARSYSSVKEFLQAIITDQNEYQRIVTEANKITDLFYMVPYRKSKKQKPPYDLNVLRVWAEDENFGDDIKITIISDGVDGSHPDLVESHDGSLNQDYVSAGSSSETNPNIDADAGIEDINNPHEGTKAAGLIAMKLNNGLCGIGIAPKAKINSLPLINKDNKLSMNKLIAELKHLHDVNDSDIVLNTWVSTYRKFSKLKTQLSLHKAYYETAVKGRSGKGLIHVVPVGAPSHAIGVGELACGRNLIINNSYTIPVAATEYDGRRSSRSAACAAVMVTAFSTDGRTNPQYKMRTTGLSGGCTDDKEGSKAAASLVAGVLALALKANPNLTYRDVQHLIVMTSEVAPIKDQDINTWTRNKAGFYVSNSYGFGMINAYNLVQMAKQFKTVPPVFHCHGQFGFRMPVQNWTKLFREPNPITQRYTIGVPDDCSVNYIEHVLLNIRVTNRLAGMIDIRLTSAQGTSTDLFRYRKGDDQFGDAMTGWMFDSITTWGESPKGLWTVSLTDKYSMYGSYDLKTRCADINLDLIVRGTKEPPEHYDVDDYGIKYRSYMKPAPYDAFVSV